jgi:hypothetical protein
VRQTLAQPSEQTPRACLILVRIAAQIAAALDLSGALDQGQVQGGGAHVPGLTHPVAIESHEVGRLVGEVGKEDLGAVQLGVQMIGQCEKGIGVHSPPPKTATSRNRQGGVA